MYIYTYDIIELTTLQLYCVCVNYALLRNILVNVA